MQNPYYRYSIVGDPVEQQITPMSGSAKTVCQIIASRKTEGIHGRALCRGRQFRDKAVCSIWIIVSNVARDRIEIGARGRKVEDAAHTPAARRSAIISLSSA